MAEKNPYHIEGNDDSGYVGVGLEYQNYANETEKPYLTEQDEKALKLVEPDTEFVKGSDDKASQGAPTDAPEKPSAPKAPAPKADEK